MADRLAGKVCIITGAGRGIGRAIAERFAADGAILVLAARSGVELEATAEVCRARGARAEVVPTDVAERDAVEAMVARAAGLDGHIDAFVHCAGIYGPIGASATVDPDEWMRAIDVNLGGTFLTCRYVVPHMLERRAGKIVLLAGGGATAPLPFFSAYAASKAAVVRFADTLAEEVREDGIQVNAVAPGLVDTQLQDDVLAAGERAGPLLEKIRAARETGAGAVSADVAAELALFLASEASGALTGKLVSAPYDPWREWEGEDERLNATPLYTIRRLDEFTLRPLIDELR